MPEGGDLPRPPEPQSQGTNPTTPREPSSEGRFRHLLSRAKDVLKVLDARDVKRPPTLQNVSEFVANQIAPQNGELFPQDLSTAFGQGAIPDSEFAEASRITLYELVRRGALEPHVVGSPEKGNQQIKYTVKDPLLLRKIAEGKE